MPIYEYECAKCSKIAEIFQKFSDKPLTKCQHCGGKLRKLISHSSFHLKGTGWYVTDYANKSKTSSSAEKKPKKAKTSPAEKSSSSSKESKASGDNSAT